MKVLVLLFLLIQKTGDFKEVAPGEYTLTVSEDRNLEDSAETVVTKDRDLDALPDNPDDLRNMLQALAGPMSAQIVVDGFSGSIVSDTRLGITRNANYQYGDVATPSLIVSNAFNGGSSQTGRASTVNNLIEIQNNMTAVHAPHPQSSESRRTRHQPGLAAVRTIHRDQSLSRHIQQSPRSIRHSIHVLI